MRFLLVFLLSSALSHWSQGSDSETVVWAWEDTSGVAPTEYVLANEEQLFQKQQNTSVGGSTSVWWVRVPMNGRPSDKPYLRLSGNRLLIADFIFRDRDKTITVSAGAQTPVSSRQLHTLLNAFDTSVLPTDATAVFVKIKSQEFVSLRYDWINLPTLLSESELTDIKLYLALTILLFLILANLDSAIRTRERFFFYYTGYLLTVLVFALDILQGFAVFNIPARAVLPPPVLISFPFLFLALTLKNLFGRLSSKWFIFPLYVVMVAAVLILAASIRDVQLAYSVLGNGVGMLAAACITISLIV